MEDAEITDEVTLDPKQLVITVVPRQLPPASMMPGLVPKGFGDSPDHSREAWQWYAKRLARLDMDELG